MILRQIARRSFLTNELYRDVFRCCRTIKTFSPNFERLRPDAIPLRSRKSAKSSEEKQGKHFVDYCRVRVKVQKPIFHKQIVIHSFKHLSSKCSKERKKTISWAELECYRRGYFSFLWVFAHMTFQNWDKSLKGMLGRFWWSLIGCPRS
jgi:hypothetical protein